MRIVVRWQFGKQKTNRLENVRSFLAFGSISDRYRGWIVKDAVKKGHIDIVKTLLASGALISEEDRGGAVILASVKGHLEIVQLLLANGDKISEEDRGKAIEEAVWEGHLAVVEFYFDLWNISEKDREQAIRTASIRGHLDILQFFLANADSTSSKQKVINFALFIDGIPIKVKIFLANFEKTLF